MYAVVATAAAVAPSSPPPPFRPAPPFPSPHSRAAVAVDAPALSPATPPSPSICVDDVLRQLLQLGHLHFDEVLVVGRRQRHRTADVVHVGVAPGGF